MSVKGIVPGSGFVDLLRGYALASTVSTSLSAKKEERRITTTTKHIITALSPLLETTPTSGVNAGKLDQTAVYNVGAFNAIGLISSSSLNVGTHILCGSLGAGTRALSGQNPTVVEVAKLWNNTAKSNS